MTITIPNVKFGIGLGQLNPTAWAAVTEAADGLGYDSVWMPEHLVLPVQLGGSPFAGSDHPPLPPDVDVFDPFVYLAYLAGRTERIRFGTHVYNIGLRHPFSTARAVATLDVVSRGRVEFGIGASWLAAEWDAVGLDFANRGGRVDEALEVCLRLWAEPTVEHHGASFDFDAVAFEPKPVQRPHPPVHVGGDGPAALRRAATLGDGWIPMNHTVDELAPAVERLAELRAAAGRPGRTEITLGLTPGSAADVTRYAAAGVDRLIVRPWWRTADAPDSIARFAAEYLGGP